MSEGDWLQCTDISRMFELLYHKRVIGYSSKNGSCRKMRLLACACCRRIWHILDDRSRRAVEVAERYADHAASEKERGRVASFACEALAKLPSGDYKHTAANAAYSTVISDEPPEATSYGGPGESTCNLAAWAIARFHFQGDGWRNYDLTDRQRVIYEKEAGAQSLFVRDIFGNPFRPVALDPAWQTATVLSLAQAIYDERTFERMPVLGDALEEAGCTNAEVLNHCRQPGEHVRGCWVVDLVLGKE